MVDKDKLLDMVCAAPDRQIDESVKTRLLALKGRPDAEIKDELLGIIDDCVYASLTSDFVIKALEVIWTVCGGTDSEIHARNVLIGGKGDMEKLKAKYKWQCCDFS